LKRFRYVAVDKKGKNVKEYIYGNSKQDAHAAIEARELYPISIEEARESKIKFQGINLSFGRVKEEELIVFTEQLSTLVSAGLTITDALSGLSEQIENKTFKKIIDSIRNEIEHGASLSGAFKKYGKMLPPIYVSLLAVGEATGALDKVLKGIANYLERDLEIRRKIGSAFAYPKFVVMVVLAVVVFLVTVILPKFVSMYTQTGEALPTPTKILLQVSYFLRFKWEFLVGAFLILFVLYKVYYATSKGKLIIDRYKLTIPVFGKISKLGSLSRFLHSFALILGSGINIVDTISIAANVTGNAYIIQELSTIRESIKQGRSTAESMHNRSFFPKIMVQMFAVGERSGSLDTMANKLGELWDRDLDNTISNMAAKIEPTLMVVLGVIVGFIAIAMYLPMFSMPTLLKKTF